MTVPTLFRRLSLPFIILILTFMPGDGQVEELHSMAQPRYAGKVNAPDFPRGLQWLNTDHPISLKELRGKVVLLDFWTFCCINCMHVIPDLKKLEEKYGSALVVIGVHSAKFTTEQGTKNIREVILRYGIAHPVINDKDFEVWNSYTANAWPTFMLIDPEGKVIGRHAGEGAYDVLDPVIGETVKEFESRGALNRTPIVWKLEQSVEPESFLSYPGKVTASADGTRLYVTDSNHNRVVVISIPDGTVVYVFGSGAMGLKDGSVEEAEFNRPQGIAVDDSMLYVADTENHAIRVIDLKMRTVATLAGTGRQARDFNVPGRGTGVELNSPWDLIKRGDTLFVAMAGFHQIWTINVKTGEAAPLAGSGRENIVDGPLRQAALAQPSGITSDGTHLYIADSEVSGVRDILAGAGGYVRTIVGTGLFDFGDKDGEGEHVRLQHPIGIAWTSHGLFVADTYNNKLKLVDPESRRVKSVVGTGKAGMRDGRAADAELNEPNGLVAVGDVLYIADTNNHLIRTYDTRTGEVSTLALKGIEKRERGRMAKAFTGEEIVLPARTVSPGSGAIELTIAIPDGYHLNDSAPFYLGVNAGNVGAVEVAGPVEQNLTNPTFPIRIPVRYSAGTSQVEMDAIVYYCREGKESLCLIKQLRLKMDITVAPGAGSADAVAKVRFNAGV
jgi:DNA-binding beta-propeller fold protein YncE